MRSKCAEEVKIVQRVKFFGIPSSARPITENHHNKPPFGGRLTVFLNTPTNHTDSDVPYMNFSTPHDNQGKSGRLLRSTIGLGSIRVPIS
jgi:hypothetical protein